MESPENTQNVQQSSARRLIAVVGAIVLIAVIGLAVSSIVSSAHKGGTEVPAGEMPSELAATSSSDSASASTSTSPSASSSAPSASPLLTYTIPNYGVTFSYPRGYALVTAADNASGTPKFVRPAASSNSLKLIELNQPHVGGLDISFGFIPLIGSTTIEEMLFGDGKTSIEQTYDSYNAQILSTDTVKVGGVDSLRFVLKLPDGTSLTDIYVPYGESGTLLQFRYSPSTGPTAAIVDTVQFGN